MRERERERVYRFQGIKGAYETDAAGKLLTILDPGAPGDVDNALQREDTYDEKGVRLQKKQ